MLEFCMLLEECLEDSNDWLAYAGMLESLVHSFQELCIEKL